MRVAIGVFGGLQVEPRMNFLLLKNIKL